MPMDLKRYPADWPAISARIRIRDGWVCKYCGAPHGVRVMRRYGVCHGHPIPAFFAWAPWAKLARMERGRLWYRVEDPEATKIILTVAHLGAPHADGTPGNPHDKMDVREENLGALCQRCHLMFDLEDHVINAAHTRRAARVAGGQGELL